MDFGLQPNSMHLLPSPQTAHRLHPLVLSTCPACDFVFIAEPMEPEEFYGEVQLSTSTSPARHLDSLIESLTQRLTATVAPLVLEIGCNDGLFLEKLRAAGLSRLFGLEPAAGCAQLARERGLAVETGYFGRDAAQAFLARHGQPDLVICRHVLEHVTELDDFMAALALLLGEKGQLLLEMPDLAAIEAQGDCSAIWEQHVNYFDLSTLTHLLARFGLRVTEHRSIDYGGGALLAMAAPGPADQASSPRGRVTLQDRLTRHIRSFRVQVGELADKKARIVAFGAGMRGAMLLSLTGVAGMLECVLDDNPLKIGRYFPGTLLPIRSSQILYENRPDICIVMPMNAKEIEWAIMARHQEFVQAGGRFMEVLPREGGIARLVDGI